MKWMKAERSIILNHLGVSSSQWILFNVQETGNYSMVDKNNHIFYVIKIKAIFNVAFIIYFQFFKKINF